MALERIAVGEYIPRMQGVFPFSYKDTSQVLERLEIREMVQDPSSHECEIFSASRMSSVLIPCGTHYDAEFAHEGIDYKLASAGVFEPDVSSIVILYRWLADFPSRQTYIAQRTGEIVMQHVLSEAKRKGYSKATLHAEARERKHLADYISGLHYSYEPACDEPVIGAMRAYFIDLSGFEERELSYPDMRRLIGFLAGKPNMNLGIVDISQLCMKLGTMGVAEISEYTGADPEDTLAFLSDRLASVYMQDFQTSPERARELIEELRGKIGA